MINLCLEYSGPVMSRYFIAFHIVKPLTVKIIKWLRLYFENGLSIHIVLQLAGDGLVLLSLVSLLQF